MKSELSQELEERFQLYQEFGEQGAWFSAVTKLAEIFHCLPLLRKDQQVDWTRRILNLIPSERELAIVKAGVGNEADRVRRILSIGNEWQAEEIILVLTTRVEIDLLLNFLNKCLSIEFSVFLEDIDRDIEALSNTKSHRRHFTWAIQNMKQNWGLPINSKWLGDSEEV